MERAYPEFKKCTAKIWAKAKCIFQSKLARILGHVATPAGIHSNDQRIEDILKAPIVSQLKSFWK